MNSVAPFVRSDPSLFLVLPLIVALLSPYSNHTVPLLVCFIIFSPSAWNSPCLILLLAPCHLSSFYLFLTTLLSVFPQRSLHAHLSLGRSHPMWSQWILLEKCHFVLLVP